MSIQPQKPTKEAKALSLYLMAFKGKTPMLKEKLKRINRSWDLVKQNEISKEDYLKEVQELLTAYGGYEAVVEKTVQHYINTTGVWKQNGDDQYCIDANKIAESIFIKRGVKQ